MECSACPCSLPTPLQPTKQNIFTYCYFPTLSLYNIYLKAEETAWPSSALQALSGSTRVWEPRIQPGGREEGWPEGLPVPLAALSPPPPPTLVLGHKQTSPQSKLRMTGPHQPPWPLQPIQIFSRTIQRAQAAPQGPPARTESPEELVPGGCSWSACWIRPLLFFFLALINAIMFKINGVNIAELYLTWLFWISYYTFPRYSSYNTVRTLFPTIFQSLDYIFKIRG